MPLIYQTMKSIENPIGDGRYNRSSERSPLEKNTIPAGFVFAIADDGSIEDRSRAVFTIPVARKGSSELAKKLAAVATAPLDPVPEEEETFESVLASVPGGAEAAVSLVLKQLNISPKDLRARLMSEGRPASTSVPEVSDQP